MHELRKDLYQAGGRGDERFSHLMIPPPSERQKTSCVLCPGREERRSRDRCRKEDGDGGRGHPRFRPALHGGDLAEKDSDV
jgi:hypothetical protein